MIIISKHIAICLTIVLYSNIFVTKAVSNTTNFTKSQYQELERQYKFNIKKAIDITDGQKSLPYSNKALKYAIALNDEFRIAQSYNEISHDYERIGDLSKALRYVIMASNKYEKIGKIEEMGMVYNRIGCLYSIQRNENLAIIYLNKALTLHKKINAYTSYADDLNNLGEVYRIGKRYGKAMKNFMEAYTIFLANKDSVNFAYVSGNIGLVYAAQNKMDSANYYLALATNILQKKGDFYPITVYLNDISITYFERGNIKEALKKAGEALEIAKNQNLKEQIRDVNQLLVRIYSKLGDYKNAFFSLKEYQRFKDSIVNEKTISDMAEMRADFEVSKKETEIKGLQAINKLRNRINIGLGIGVLLVTVLTFFLFRFNKNLKIANQLLSLQKTELEQKNDVIHTSLVEKETLLKEIHHRVKNNLQIISSLLSLQSQNVKNKKALEAFSESQQRLHSIALIHQKLYQNENLANISIKEYIGDLTEAIRHAFYSENKKISCHLNITDINLDIDTAVPLGLIINELVTNAYKYAFNRAKEGEVFISLGTNNNGAYKLIVKDNGSGLPENLNIFEAESLGLKLVSILSRQLKGKLEVKSNKGTEFCLNFVDVIQYKL